MEHSKNSEKQNSSMELNEHCKNTETKEDIHIEIDYPCR
jgi:hypothetical protein